MPWDQSRPGTDPKYRTAEHRGRRATLVRRIKRGEHVECMAVVCLFGDRTITNPNGNDADGLHLGHHDDGVTYRGPEHRACNLHDAAVRASARSHGTAVVETRSHWSL